MGYVCGVNILHCALQLQPSNTIRRRIWKLVGVCWTRLPERLVHVHAGPDAASAGVLQLRRQSLRQLSREWQVQLLLVQSAAVAHVCGKTVSRFFGIGVEQFGRVIIHAALMALMALGAAPAAKHAHVIAVQAVLHNADNVTALGLGGQCTYADQHCDQRNKRQKNHGYIIYN